MQGGAAIHAQINGFQKLLTLTVSRL